MKPTTFLIPMFFATACGTDVPAEPDRDATPGSVETDAGRDSGSSAPDTSSNDDAGIADFSVVPDLSEGPPDLGQTDASAVDMPDSVDMAGADVADAGSLTEDMPATSGETCDAAVDATSGGTFAGDTTDVDDDYSTSASDDGCPSGQASGGDLVYSLAPAVETTYSIRVEPDGNFDPFLYVKADCAAAECVDGTVLNGPGTMESLTVTVPEGATYYVVVDGELLSEGAYTLTVTAM